MNNFTQIKHIDNITKIIITGYNRKYSEDKIPDLINYVCILFYYKPSRSYALKQIDSAFKTYYNLHEIKYLNKYGIGKFEEWIDDQRIKMKPNQKIIFEINKLHNIILKFSKTEKKNFLNSNIINFLDNKLKKHYEQHQIPYENKEGIGKFAEWIQDNGYSIQNIIEDLENDPMDALITNFDTNIPFNENKENKQLQKFMLILNFYKEIQKKSFTLESQVRKIRLTSSLNELQIKLKNIYIYLYCPN